MKKLALFVAVLGSVAAMATEIRFADPAIQLKKDFFSGKMTGKNSHAAVSGNQEFPDCWKYYYIASGDKPENFNLQPIKAISPDSPLGKKWNQVILAASYTDTAFQYPALIGLYFYPRNRMGLAYSFTNPLNKKATLYLEGNFRRDESVRAFVYIKRADGTVKLLTDDMDPEAWQQQETKLKDRVMIRYYLKLQFEEEFAPGDTLVIACTPRNGKFPASKYIAGISGWGAKWNPVISLEVNE